MDKYPAGLWAKTKCFRVVKSVFTKDCESFVLSRMRHSYRNIKPIVIIDDNTKDCICKIPNETLTGFIDDSSLEAQLLCLQIKQSADYQIKKTKIQNSSKSKEQKQKEIEKL
jgi:hypothetical protein